MTETLADFLTAQQADSAHLQHAVRYLVAEITADKPPEQMLCVLRADASSSALLDDCLMRLRQNGPTLAKFDLAVLDAFWADTKSRSAVSRAVQDAKVKLPVIEIALVTVAAMYGMYLVVTRGKKSETRTTMKPDGSYETETTTYHNPADVLSIVGRLFGSIPPREELAQRPGEESEDSGELDPHARGMALPPE